jgi:DNA-binding winged helix-turn-helix (wHTH) protein
MTYRFDAFQLNVEQHHLDGPTGSYELPETLFRILVLLLEARGSVVTRDELIRNVWDDGFVADATINQHIFRLRKLLGDGAPGASFIVTEPGRGYRLDASVIEACDHRSSRHEIVGTLPR